MLQNSLFARSKRRGCNVTGPINGTNASSPAEISQRGWWDVLRRSSRAMVAQKMSLAAAGIAFYVVWAFFPALALIVVLVALLLGKAQVLALLSSVPLDLPTSFHIIVVSQLDAIAESSHGLSITTVLGTLGFSVWSGMRGARALMAALNLVYHERERRNFWYRQALALGLCLLGGAFVLGALTLIVGLAGTGFSITSLTVPALLAPSRWPVLIVAMMLLLSVAYRYGPCRRIAKWRWVTWGATVSATIWVSGSSLLSYYTAHYTHLNPLIGSVGSVMIFSSGVTSPCSPSCWALKLMLNWSATRPKTRPQASLGRSGNVAPALPMRCATSMMFHRPRHCKTTRAGDRTPRLARLDSSERFARRPGRRRWPSPLRNSISGSRRMLSQPSACFHAHS